MAIHRGLTLAEELMLLALRDREGTVDPRAGHYQLALGGAILAELELAGRVEIEDSRRAYVRVADGARLDNAELDECLSRVAAAGRRATAATWVARFARVPRLRHRIAAGLCRLGVLKADEASILLFFRRKIYPEVDHRPESRLLERLRSALTSDADVDARTRILLSLMKAARMLRVVFTGKELRTRAARLKQLTSGSAASGAVGKAVEAIEAAAAAAVMSAVIASTG